LYYQQPYPGQVPPSAQYNQYNGEVVAGLSYYFFLVGTVTGAAASLGTGSPSRTIAVLVVTLFALALYLVYLGALIWGTVAAFTGKATKLPLLRDLAERWSGTPIPPGQVRY
jgi:hypothetical protein